MLIFKIGVRAFSFGLMASSSILNFIYFLARNGSASKEGFETSAEFTIKAPVDFFVPD